MSAPNPRNSWKISASIVAKRTSNPIRAIVDHIKVKPNPEKSMISLALGDPTLFGNFKIHQSCTDAVVKQLQSYKTNGYPPSTGYPQARKAVADKFSTPEAPLTAQDVILASGCSGAIDMCIGVLCNEGDNILVPRPGFSLYQTCADSKGVEVRYYDLLPDKNWEMDLAQLETLIDERTTAVIMNNPSNPCGSVFRKQHLLDFLQVCERHYLPVIADEIYCDLVFSGNEFFPLASLTKTVPILSVGGLAKKYLVPGWRLGWIFIHDRNDVFAAEVRDGLVSLSQLILGPNSLVQGALEDILHQTDKSFHDDTCAQLEANAKLSTEILSKVPGLKVIVPQGAMYVMIGINVSEFKDIPNDIVFTEKLLGEESVMCLPGSVFQCPNFIRIVFTSPPEVLRDAYQRMAEFCARHHA
ncbi:MAG: tyrosine aminotransferase [Benniella sp.]|nr:MAG: tyrosine aminotransferase [Benniella sp.]